MSQNSIEQLRAANRVVPVSKEDEGISWSKISNSVYGFTYTPGSSDGGFFMKPSRSSFEMHKLADGTLHIVGYTTTEFAEKLKSKGAQDIEVFPEVRDQYNVLVTIPHARLASSKPLDRDNFNQLKLSLKPIA
jgi:hypothetical protein